MVAVLQMPFWNAYSIWISLQFVPAFPINNKSVLVPAIALVPIMAWRLFGAKPLLEPVLEYCWLDPWEQTSVKFSSNFIYFHSNKMHSKKASAKWRSFCPVCVCVCVCGWVGMGVGWGWGWVKFDRFQTRNANYTHRTAKSVFIPWDEPYMLNFGFALFRYVLKSLPVFLLFRIFIRCSPDWYSLRGMTEAANPSERVSVYRLNASGFWYPQQ